MYWISMGLAMLNMATGLYVLAESDCPPVVGLDPNVVPFTFDHDPEDTLLPLWPGDPTRWYLPTGRWTRPPALACDPDGQAMTVVCQYWTCPSQPAVIYDPNAGTWSTIIDVTPGINKAVYRATDIEGDFDDFEIVWRRVNRPPVLH
ncbi:MAG: hypothetical protein ACYTAN_06920 [Planctomycetota bacterium]|jgi:hypothetical protein